jgi:hypothetical protein
MLSACSTLSCTPSLYRWASPQGKLSFTLAAHRLVSFLSKYILTSPGLHLQPTGSAISTVNAIAQSLLLASSFTLLRPVREHTLYDFNHFIETFPGSLQKRLVFYLFGRNEVWTQDFMLARRALYCLSHASSPGKGFLIKEKHKKFTFLLKWYLETRPLSSNHRGVNIRRVWCHREQNRRTWANLLPSYPPGNPPYHWTCSKKN